MKLLESKTLIAGGLVLSAAVLLIILTEIFGSSSRLTWPKIQLSELENQNKQLKDFSIEKVIQTQQNGTDMRSDLYLTHHRYFLEKVANIEVKYRQKTLSLNDICFKPQLAIFEKFQDTKKPNYIDQLFLEIRRLSPCLITTPLNCFYDSYMIHSQISHWNESTDFHNRKLRNAYIESLDEGVPRVYVKSDYGPDLIKQWSEHMFQLAADKKEKERDNWAESVKKWISSIEPRRKVCADPMRSCDNAPDAENYFNICMVMQQMNDFDERRHQTLKFELDKSDEEFTTKLDCVEDREKFIEWMQERELKGILKTFAPEFDLPDHQKIIHERCDGIYHDYESAGIDFFNGHRTFSGPEKNYDSIRTEVALMTPESLLKAMQHSDYVNGHETMWTLDRSAELLQEFRLALRDEVDKFNEHRASKKIRVTTRMDTIVEVEDPEEESITRTASIVFLFYAAVVIPCIFCFLVWTNNPTISAAFFFLRFAVTALLYVIFCNQDGVVVLDESVLYALCLFLPVALSITTANSMLRDRLERTIQRMSPELYSSNFSSFRSVGSFLGTPRIVAYTMDKYFSFQSAQDTDSHEKFEKIPRCWPLMAGSLLIGLPFYWYFIDPQIYVIMIVVKPSVVIGMIEEYRIKKNFLKEKQRIKQKIEMNSKALQVQEDLSEERIRMLFGGKPEHEMIQDGFELQEFRSDVPLVNTRQELRMHKGELLPLSTSAYDNTCFSVTKSPGREIRLLALRFYLNLLALIRPFAILISLSAFLCLALAIGFLFVQIPRVSKEIKSIEYDDLYLDIQITDLSNQWKEKKAILSALSKDLDSIPRLHVISNWEKGFEQFEKRMMPQNTTFSEWMALEPISWVLTAPRTAPVKGRLPDPFKFQFRYELENSKNESLTKATVQHIDDTIAKYTSDMSIRPAGLVYEHYHRNAIAWNSFSSHELLVAVVFLSAACLIVKLFVPSPPILAVVLFSVFFVATRLQVAAFLHVFSIDQHFLYLYFATLVSFRAVLPSFGELCRFRCRVLLKEKNQTRPEQRTKRRIRVPFVAFVDTVHFFAALITVCLVFSIVSVIFPQLRTYFIPTVILVGIQLLAIFNAIVISLVTRLMFEPKVSTSLLRDLNGDSMHKKLKGMVTKIPMNSPICAQRNIIQPVRLQRYRAPPPPKQRRVEEGEESEDEEQDEKNIPGPSGLSSGQNLDPESSSPSLKRKREPLLGRQLPMSVALANQPAHRVLCGEPFDARVNYENQMEEAEVYDAVGDDRLADAIYGMDEESDDEDYDSQGEPDEEILKVVADLTRRREERDRNEPGPSNRPDPSYDEYLPGPSNAPVETDDDQPGPSNRPQQPPVPEEEDDSDDEPAGLNASPSPPPNDSQPIAPDDYADPLDLPMPRAIRRPGRPPIVQRTRPRNPLVDPPIIMEYIEQFDVPNLPPHPRANMYPRNWTYGMVAYAEDPYWTQRIGPLPPGVMVPPRPADYMDLSNIGEPPLPRREYNPPPGNPPIPIPPEAIELWDRNYEMIYQRALAARERRNRGSE